MTGFVLILLKTGFVQNINECVLNVTVPYMTVIVRKVPICVKSLTDFALNMKSFVLNVK